MKKCCIVVLYNPTLEVIDNINTYSSYFEKTIIVDNSDNEQINIIKKIKLNTKDYIYIKENGNTGIANALKDGMKIAIDEKFEWCLTMDQDSKVELNNDEFNEIDTLLFKNAKYGIISFNFNNTLKLSKKQSIKRVKTWITSGNFINVELYKKQEGFNEKLFIDYVDFDLCRQFYYNKIPVGVLKKSINHKIGNPIEKSILFINFSCMNHNPIRYYYRYRNSLYLFKKNKLFYFKIFIHEYIIDFLKMLLFEKNRFEKIKMIKCAIKDALKNKLGKYGGDVCD